jgi:putative transposase
MLVLDLVVALPKKVPGLGTRKLYLLLQEPFAQRGIRIGRDKLHNLLQAHGLILRYKRQAPKTTNSAHGLQKCPNLLSNQLITAPQQVWVCDITYLCVGLGFGYLSLITDAYFKLIVGYCLHPLLTSEGCLRALEMALHQERPQATTLIYHSDRGSRFCSSFYINKLREAGIAISMR